MISSALYLQCIDSKCIYGKCSFVLGFVCGHYFLTKTRISGDKINHDFTSTIWVLDLLSTRKNSGEVYDTVTFTALNAIITPNGQDEPRGHFFLQRQLKYSTPLPRPLPPISSTVTNRPKICCIGQNKDTRTGRGITPLPQFAGDIDSQQCTRDVISRQTPRDDCWPSCHTFITVWCVSLSAAWTGKHGVVLSRGEATVDSTPRTSLRVDARFQATG